jgi:hypothetical protein
MKAYVNYYDGDGKRARETIGDNSIRDDQCVVQFSASPDRWKLNYTEAYAVCGELNHAEISSVKWPGHECHFTVEQVGEFEYVVVCPDHPAF